MLAFGIIFPTGMVMGVSGNSAGADSTEVDGEWCTDDLADDEKPMARTDTGFGNSSGDCGLLYGTLTQRTTVCAECPFLIREFSDVHARCTSRNGHILEATSGERDQWEDTALCCHRTWRIGEIHASRVLGTNDLWRNHGSGILP